MTDVSGEVTFAARYSPWGDTLETYGTGNFEFGYYGGIMDAATGLLYVGNGQYYDPATGRFLTRDARPNQNNPYTPFDPMGALFAPLGLVALVYSRRKKGSKWAVLLVILSFAVVTGMTLSASGGSSTPTEVKAEVTQAPAATQIVVSTPTNTPIATVTIPPAPIPAGTYNCTVSLAFQGNGAAAYEGLLKAGLLNASGQEILAFAIEQEFWVLGNGQKQLDNPNAEPAQSMIKAMTRRYYEKGCQNCALSESCLGWYWGYFQGILDGGGRPVTQNARNLAMAIMTPGDISFNGLTVNSTWKTEGCSTGGVCHWANAKSELVTELKKVVVPDANGNYSYVVDNGTGGYSHATFLFSIGPGEYYVVLVTSP